MAYYICIDISMGFTVNLSMLFIQLLTSMEFCSISTLSVTLNLKLLIMFPS